MANWKKVEEALKQADQLVCATLVNSKGSKCAVGQLFYAAGKTDVEISRESAFFDYHKMFDGLLPKEYGLSSADIDSVWRANDDTHGVLTEEERVVHMAEWAGGMAAEVAS